MDIETLKKYLIDLETRIAKGEEVTTEDKKFISLNMEFLMVMKV